MKLGLQSGRKWWTVEQLNNRRCLQQPDRGSSTQSCRVRIAGWRCSLVGQKAGGTEKRGAGVCEGGV